MSESRLEALTRRVRDAKTMSVMMIYESEIAMLLRIANIAAKAQAEGLVMGMELGADGPREGQP